jgi:hypothetical protein
MEKSITSENSVRENLITIMRTVSVKMHHISFKHFPHEFIITLFLSSINTCLQFLVNIILYQISILVQIFNEIYLNYVYFYYYYKFIFDLTIKLVKFYFFFTAPLSISNEIGLPVVKLALEIVGSGHRKRFATLV